jgi:hypothetical protein
MQDMHSGIVLLKFSHAASHRLAKPSCITLPYPTLLPAYLGIIAYMQTCSVHKQTGRRAGGRAGWLAREGPGWHVGRNFMCVAYTYNLRRLRRGCKACGIMHSNVDRHSIQNSTSLRPFCPFPFLFSHCHLFILQDRYMQDVEERSEATVGRGSPPPSLLRG